jgi:hypothetical protein
MVGNDRSFFFPVVTSLRSLVLCFKQKKNPRCSTPLLSHLGNYDFSVTPNASSKYTGFVFAVHPTSSCVDIDNVLIYEKFICQFTSLKFIFRIIYIPCVSREIFKRVCHQRPLFHTVTWFEPNIPMQSNNKTVKRYALYILPRYSWMASPPLRTYTRNRSMGRLFHLFINRSCFTDGQNTIICLCHISFTYFKQFYESNIYF